jgi:hypothetical protein
MEIIIKNYIKENWLGTRDMAFSIRKTFESNVLNSSEEIIFNFESVWIITQSSIDELIWVFITNEWVDILNRFQFKNCNDKQREIIKFVIIDRVNRLKSK